MARSPAGLTEPDIAELQRQLADGKRPRVRLSGPHFPVAAAGTVVRIGSPDTDGADYVRVRVKVNGMTDELAFAPSELSLPSSRARPGKAGRAAKATGDQAGRTARASGEQAGRTAKATDGGARRTAKAAPRTASAAGPAKAAARAAADSATAADSPVEAAPAEAGRGPQRASASPNEQAAAGRKPGTQPGRKAAAAKVRKLAPAKVSFTVTSSGANWALTATRGAKNLIRGAQLPPGVVTAVADLLSQPALSDAVSEINDAALAEARARAEQLRAELDELEAVLALHRRP
jgi:hypothetical protein